MVTSSTVCSSVLLLSWSKISDLDLQIISGVLKPLLEFVGELSNTIMQSRDTIKSTSRRTVRAQKRGRWRSFLVRAFPPLSLAYLARYPSYGPVTQAKTRLGEGWGGGSTLLFMFSLCRIIGGSFWTYVALGWNINLLIVFQCRFIRERERQNCTSGNGTTFPVIKERPKSLNWSPEPTSLSHILKWAKLPWNLPITK